MKVLVFDTETTGLPTERNPLITETEKFPYIVQLSYILYDDQTNHIINIQDDIIKLPENVVLPEESVKIHGITREKSNKKGIPISDALDKFNELIKESDIIVGHNTSFDRRLIMVECIRNDKPMFFDKKNEFCTMFRSINLCAIEKVNPKTGEKYFKYPNLSELHEKLFGNKPKGTHDSMADILICMRCYERMKSNKDIVKKGSASFKELYNLYCV
jgi:DNA polymerase III epsilon subunit-like protein